MQKGIGKVVILFLVWGDIAEKIPARCGHGGADAEKEQHAERREQEFGTGA